MNAGTTRKFKRKKRRLVLLMVLLLLLLLLLLRYCCYYATPAATTENQIRSLQTVKPMRLSSQLTCHVAIKSHHTANNLHGTALSSEIHRVEKLYQLVLRRRRVHEIAEHEIYQIVQVFCILKVVIRARAKWSAGFSWLGCSG